MPYHTFNAGDEITVHPTPPGIRKSGPAANWIKEPTKVTLTEDAISGTWDVFDVLLDDGSTQSIYGFNIEDDGSIPDEMLGDDDVEKLSAIKSDLVKIADIFESRKMYKAASVLDEVIKDIK